MIKTAGTKPATERTIRRTTCKWISNGAKPGEIDEKDVDVLYYSPTIKELREVAEMADRHVKENPGKPFYLTQGLILRLHSMPDLKLGVGQPEDLTLDWLDSQDLNNIESIQKAINEDLNPKAQPVTSPSG